MATITIRRANFNDSYTISKVHVQSWQETYTHIFSKNFLNSLNIHERKKRWDYVLKEPLPLVFVAEVNKQIVGFCSIEMRENPRRNSPYLATLYLLKKYQKNGIGKKLFFTAQKELKKLNYIVMYIEVLEENSTLNFYKKYGSKIVGQQLIKNTESTSINELLLKYEFI